MFFFCVLRWFFIGEFFVLVLFYYHFYNGVGFVMPMSLLCVLLFVYIDECR